MSPLLWLLFVLLSASFSLPAHAHDPSAWGGLFRSRDFGANWFPADAGLFIGGALGVAISPRNPAEILYGTDARLLHSANGGRDWLTDASGTMQGPVFAVAFNPDGKGALASSSTRIFYAEDGVTWRDTLAPGGAAPARAFVRSSAVLDRVYLAGARGLFVSDDRGKSWQRAGEGVLPDSSVSMIVIPPKAIEKILLVIKGSIWTSVDGARTWQNVATNVPPGRVETLATDMKNPDRLWAVAEGQVFKSDDSGVRWVAYGRPLPDAGTLVRGLAVSVDGKILLLSTHRGVLRSSDSGQNWLQVESTLPVHLESGFLLRDPHDPSTLYAGFSLAPYGEVWRRAEEGGSLLMHLDPISLMGGAAFLLLLIIVGIIVTRWLLHRYQDANTAPRSR